MSNCPDFLLELNYTAHTSSRNELNDAPGLSEGS